MLKPQVSESRVIIGPCRLSYTHLFDKYDPDNTGNGKFMTNVLIPKSEKETIKAIEAAIEAAKKNGIMAKWGGKEPRKIDLPLRDGADKAEKDPVYDGVLYLNAKSGTRPGVVDRNRQPILDEEEVYSGMWGVVSLSFYAYDVNGNRGIACGLNNVMKTRDDERLGGRMTAESDFAGISFDDEDDDEL